MRVLARTLPDARYIVSGVKQHTIDDQAIRRMAVADVETVRTYKSGAPDDSGLMSRLMGVCDPASRCKTCGLKVLECPTHVGRLRLGLPLVYPHFDSLAWKVASAVCGNCSALMSGKVCGACQSPAYTFKRLNGSMEVVFPGGQKLVCPQLFLQGVLAGISDETWRTLAERLDVNPDATHPTHWVTSEMCISPPATRPSNATEKGFSSDDISTLLQQVLQANAALRAALPDTEDIMQMWEASQTPAVIEKWQALNTAFVMLFKNKAGKPDGARRRNGQQAAGVEESLNGKEGDLRKNAAGKRSHQSARAVLTGTSSSLGIDEIGINGTMQTLTRGVRVADYMPREYVESLMERSVMVEYNGNKVNTAYLRQKKNKLPYPDTGTVIHVPIDVGDTVLLNRQPTLGPLSFRCLKVAHIANPQGSSKPTYDGYTLRMHLGITPPLNADFDGDEGNIHAAVNPAVEAEFHELMSAPALLLNPANGMCFGGMVQNCITGMYLLMQAELDMPDAMQLVTEAGLSVQLPRHGTITGRELVSRIIPWRLSVKAGDLHIVNGRVVAGSMRKKNVGIVLRAIAKDVSCDAAIQFCTDAARLADAYLGKHGLTFRYEELLNDDEQADMRRIVADISSMDVRKNIDRERLRNTLLESSEKIKKRLSGIDSSIADLVLHSGAKGSAINLAMFSGVQGLQEVSGTVQFTDGPLPCFSPDNVSPQTVGFIQGNYMTGLAPQEVFAASGVTRQQMGDQSIFTGRCGHLGRKIEHLLEAEHTAWGGSVLTYDGVMVQWRYGGDGLLPEKIETITVKPPGVGDSRTWALACRKALHRCWLPWDRDLQLSVCMDPTRWLLGHEQFHVPGPAASPRQYVACLERFEASMKKHGMAGRHTKALMWCLMRPSTKLSVGTLCNMLLYARLCFECCTAPAGLPIGMIAATSVSAPINQWSLNSVHASSAGSASSSNVVGNLTLTVEAALKQPSVLRARPVFRDPPSLAQALVKCSWELLPIPPRPNHVTAALWPDRTFGYAYRVQISGSMPLWAVAQRFDKIAVPQYVGDALEILCDSPLAQLSGSSGCVQQSRITDDGMLEIEGGLWAHVALIQKHIEPLSLVCTNTQSCLSVLGVESAVVTTAGKLIGMMRAQGEVVLARHLDAVARRMGKFGTLHGANSKGVSHGPPLTAGKFEKVVPTLMRNALTGVCESPLTSLSGVVLTGGRWRVYTDIMTDACSAPKHAPPVEWVPRSPVVRAALDIAPWEPGSPQVSRAPQLVSTNVDF